MILVGVIGMVALLGSIALPMACSLAFSWSVERRRVEFTQCDWAVGSLLGCGGLLNVLVSVGAFLPSAALARSLGASELHVVAASQGLASLAVLGTTALLAGASLGRKDAGLLLAILAPLLVGSSTYAPFWLGSMFVGYCLWYVLLGVMLVADVASPRTPVPGSCPRCGYDVQGLWGVSACPECGNGGAAVEAEGERAAKRGSSHRFACRPHRA